MVVWCGRNSLRTGLTRIAGGGGGARCVAADVAPAHRCVLVLDSTGVCREAAEGGCGPPRRPRTAPVPPARECRMNRPSGLAADWQVAQACLHTPLRSGLAPATNAQRVLDRRAPLWRVCGACFHLAKALERLTHRGMSI